MLKYFKAVIRLLLRLIVSYFWIVRYSLHPKKYSYLVRYNRVHKLCYKVLDAFDVEYHLEGMENLPSDPSFLITPNHQSNADPLVFLALFNEPTTFVAKNQIAKYPLIGRVVRLLEGEFIARGNLRQEMDVMKNIKKSLIYDARRWVVFPEGTRTKDAEKNLGEFKAGALKPALSTDKKIVPVAIYGTFRILSPKYKNRINHVQIRFLEPIDPTKLDMKGTDLAPLIQNRIQEAINEMRERDKELTTKR